MGLYPPVNTTVLVTNPKHGIIVAAMTKINFIPAKNSTSNLPIMGNFKISTKVVSE